MVIFDMALVDKALADRQSDMNQGWVNPDKWFYETRYRITWCSAEYDQNETLNRDRITSSTSPEERANHFFHSNDLVAWSGAQRLFYGAVAKEIVEGQDFDSLYEARKAQALLFTNWYDLNDEAKANLQEKYGECLHDDSISVIPTLGVNQPELEYCGEMEAKMADSRKRVLVGERLLLKLRGTDAMITDRLTVTGRGNIVLPYVWYYPDQYFVETLQHRHEILPEISPMTDKMEDFPKVGLQVVRHSPAFPWDEGWDDPKHKDIFVNLHDPKNGLTKIIDTVKDNQKKFP